MQGLLETIQRWHIHPAVDHFTVALLIVAVVTDLVASLFSTRLWLRYAALALMILGTAAAWGSNLTGGWEAHRVWDAVKAAGGPAYDTLRRHAELGEWLPWAFLVLAVWRIGVQLFGFMAGTRWLYLLVAVIAALVLSYQGYLGGKMVYDYGVGTALFNAAPSSPSPQPEATGPATPIPTVYVPTASATPQAAAPTVSASASATASAMPSATAAAAPATTSSAAPSPAPSPSPRPSDSPTPASSASSADETTTSAVPARAPGTTIRPPGPHPGAAASL
ncbi:MAG TPA: DUF2231 domain-containing protein [Candidatus Binataceae bacterium]|nr:DUF2231 domain-containing protein [Candidatus Binataceae bacterium]